MIRKDDFVNSINAILEQAERDEEINNALDVICGNDYSNCVAETSTIVTTALLDLLRNLINDEDDYIGWWLYEDVEKEVKDAFGNIIELDTPEKLYDFLVSNYKQS